MNTNKLTHILVANGDTAKLYTNLNAEDSLHKVDEKEHDIPKTNKMVDDQKGRDKVPSPSLNTLQAYEPQTDPKTTRRKEIADQIAEDLHERHKQIEELIVIAPPQLLGHLRKKFSQQVNELITHEIDKDLTSEDERSLPQHLTDIIEIHDPINDFDYERAKQFTAT